MTAATMTTRARMTTAQVVAAIVGAAFLLVGIAGFIPGITTNVGDMEFAGHESPSQLLDVFQVSILHNLVHLLFGVLGLLMARRHDTATTYLIVGGVGYLVLTLYGAVIDLGDDANFVPVNEADNWLHLGLGLAMVALGLAFRRPHRTTTSTMGRATDRSAGRTIR